MLNISSHGKWILAGEHAVLRGIPALVFPIASLGVNLRYEAQDSPLVLQLLGSRGDELKLLVWGVLEQVAQKCGRSLGDFRGRLFLESNLPVGGGLGASAALCAALSRFAQRLNWLPESEVYEFARGLEDLFHGESSGVDVAVALSGEGLRFSRGGERAVLRPIWSPHLYLSFCGQRAVTAECVAKVKERLSRDPASGHALDERMGEAVEIAERALMSDDSSGRLMDLARAMNLALSCFEEWDLTGGALSQHMLWLRGEGALAVKPTGSGAGGYVLSLWQGEPSARVKTRLLSVY